ncbi:bifunctional adenosylcobinamide kinase/adenosylcobinamide-phosphate guanylyltransferase [Spongiactinospora rosea]|uniref:Adenosylcobinamide kinase n=1 Tax=Spongiactinospora rosea TaxID=2248750 RepID=A0A366M1V5_9ACTN|nr:bifunctional adenosylcobinamide kinase/adenosylcobinamide-phosphate guanylyltransferase [Spongiactinospora rosea]RBQ20208.1 bifunctional adenosylcobinamide kinase/adenosylcobinamide-phosphate guanylyltransferase [Spongiactinospora rosea]
MKVEFRGTAGALGHPIGGCPCASCGRAVAEGAPRCPLEIVVDGVLHVGSPAPPPPGYDVRESALGVEISAPGGARLLHHTGRPGPSASPFDVVAIDLLGEPSRLGVLRRAGAVDARTQVIAVGIDHRVASEAELHRRLALWGARAVPDGTVVAAGDVPAALPRPARRTLLLGGSRSGKSAEAELRLAAEPAVTYVATGEPGGDAEWRARVEAHRRRRPAHWETVESTDLAGVLRTAAPDAPLLIDGIGTWLAAVLGECGAWDDAPEAEAAVAERCAELVTAWRHTAARLVAVSDEAGLGVVPATRSGRVFRDALGRLNQALAHESEASFLVIAGRPVPLPV